MHCWRACLDCASRWCITVAKYISKLWICKQFINANKAAFPCHTLLGNVMLNRNGSCCHWANQSGSLKVTSLQNTRSSSWWEMLHVRGWHSIRKFWDVVLNTFGSAIQNNQSRFFLLCIRSCDLDLKVKGLWWTSIQFIHLKRSYTASLNAHFGNVINM